VYQIAGELQMGQAKNRGTHAERVADAVARQASHQQNFVFVFDDSETGRNALEQFLAKGPPHFVEALAPNVDEWKSLRPRYMAYCGTLAFSGGVSFAAMDDKDLLDGVLPRLMERTLLRGGLASWAIAVDPARRKDIEGRLAELQPVAGEDGHVHAPPLLLELLGAEAGPLLPPMFGGDVIPFDQVALKQPYVDQVRDQLAANAKELSQKRQRIEPDGRVQLGGLVAASARGETPRWSSHAGHGGAAGTHNQD